VIVFGDPQFQAPLSRLLEQFSRRMTSADFSRLDDVRNLLIEAGALEQGVADGWSDTAGEEPIVVARAMRVTDVLAELLCKPLLGGASSGASAGQALGLLHEAARPETGAFTIKIPEGFAFYALFPEQFCAAAEVWGSERACVAEKRVIVVGIRSIGTTLSAAVAARLRQLGWDTLRVTVRPTGHPFARTVELPRVVSGSTDHAIVVDEGPGISGSSMAAVARALAAQGLADISLFPGHEGEPGSAASPEVRQCWAERARYTVGCDELKCEGLSLREALVEHCNAWCDSSASCGSIQDLSAGQWRRVAFLSETEWPAVAGQFESMKFRVTNARGAQVLWKFSGLGCAPMHEQTLAELAMSRASLLAKQGLVPQPLGSFRGFIAMPWIDGQRLTLADRRDPAVLAHIGKYLVRSQGEPLSLEEIRSARSRLAEMLYWNAKELLGDKFSSRAQQLAEIAPTADPPRASGDGHLAPCEWIRTTEGAILKTDCFGHDCEHTFIGRQPFLWDVAGALVEWDLITESAEPMLSAMRDEGASIDLERLAFIEAAYSAFRAGLMSLAAQQTVDVPEKIRLARAVQFYTARLRRSLTPADRIAAKPC
jgi:hypothetical protein